MSTILLIAAVGLSALKAGELLEPLIPEGEPTSITYEASIMALTIALIAVLSIALAGIAGPAEPAAWDALGPTTGGTA